MWERSMHVKGTLLVKGYCTCEQDLQLTSATPRVNGTIAHGNALKHVKVCLSKYHDIPRQAIPYTIRCPPGHIIYHCQPGHTIYNAMTARPYHISCRAHLAIPYTIPCPPGHTIKYAMPARSYNILSQVQCLACQAITIYHAMPARPYHIPCDARQVILYHVMPTRP